jgi:hypothetical protein
MQAEHSRLAAFVTKRFKKSRVKRLFLKITQQIPFPWFAKTGPDNH